jgi:pimeloyl-ACP methyl ester carboxylesterase
MKNDSPNLQRELERGSRFVELPAGRIHYLKSGMGQEVLLAFHGYGLDAHTFAPVVPLLENKYTIFSFDIPHHGKSIWEPQEHLKQTDSKTDAPSAGKFTPSDVRLLIEALQSEHNFTRFTLMGYSLGGRICLNIIELFPATVDKALLIASDGLVPNPVYTFATQTLIGNNLLNAMVAAPNIYLHLIAVLHQLKLIDAARFKFFTHYLKSLEDRTFLRNVWLCLSALIPNYRQLFINIRQYGIPILLVVGQFDTIIPVWHGKKFCKKNNSSTLIVLQKGHKLIVPDTAPAIANLLLC